MPILEQEELSGELLYVSVKIKELYYAIPGMAVESIFQLEQEVTVMPDSKNEGVITYWGRVLPLVDLRKLVGVESRQQEQQTFEAMLDQRKQDHINWVTELKRCLTENAPFHLATDPHKCAFGKWYDSYRSASHAVTFHLNKIEEPHRLLHQTATEAFACPRHCDTCNREECLQSVLKRGTDQYMPRVLSLLEETKQVFREGFRQMVVVVSDGQNSCGLLVDEVTSVEALNEIKSYGTTNRAGESLLITGIAQRAGEEDLICLLNCQAILAAQSEDII